MRDSDRDTRTHCACLLFVTALALHPLPVGAQTVRGVVYDESTSQPAPGAIVSLERIRSPVALPQHVRSVLTDHTGAFAVTAAVDGPYRIAVRRIGSRPFRSDVFMMALGEARRLDVHLQRVDAAAGLSELGRITVLRATPCETSLDDAAAITRLWDDARTALLATEISSRDNLTPRRFVRFVRDLEPKSLSVESELLYDFIAPAGEHTGFTSPSGDSLSTTGYWRRTTNTSYRFHGPDASALLSQAFVEDHCFSVINSRDKPGRIGLAFEPVEHRQRRGAPAEIRGTVWLDSATSELQSLEFSWLTLPIRAPADNLGGEVLFARLAAGPWFVQRWRLRMPQEVWVSEGKGNQRTRTRRYGILEEGGFVETGNATNGRPAVITGTVRDGDRRILAGARVRIAGTDRQTTTDAEGRFRLDNVAPGRQTVVVEHERYDALGVRAGNAQVLLDEGSSRELSFVGPDADEVEALLCDGLPERGRGTIRLTFVDSATTRPMRGLRVSLTDRDGGGRGASFAVESETDASGVVVFCNAPATRPLVLIARSGKSSARAEVRLPRVGLMAQVVRWPGSGTIRL